VPNRLIREGILTSERVNLLSAQAEVFYRRLLSVVDDYGRFDGRPIMLKVSCYPLRVDVVREADISRWTAECEKAGLIVLYAVNEKRFVQVLDFHQQVRAKRSKFPPMPAEHVLCTCVADESTCVAHAHLDEDVDEDVVERRKRASQLPKDWTPPDDWLHWALAERKDWTGPHAFSVGLQFRDYWLSKGEARADWLATWRNWVRRDRSAPVVPIKPGLAL
jgi:hypothetical protein